MQRRRERAAKASWLEQTRQEASETSTERGGLSCECVCVLPKETTHVHVEQEPGRNPGTRQTDRKAKSVDDFGEMTSVLYAAKTSQGRVQGY